MAHGTEDATALLGIPELEGMAQTEEAGEIWLAVETRSRRSGCPACGTRVIGHGRRAVKVRDVSRAPGIVGHRIEEGQDGTHDGGQRRDE